MDESKPKRPGAFVAGYDPRRSKPDRRKGTVNRISADIRRDCIAGFAKHGSDGKGKDGFQGYIYFLASKHPKQAARVIEKILPLTVHGTCLVGQSVNVVSIPTNEFLSADAIAKFSPRPLLELDAPAEQIEQDASAPIEGPPASEADNEINDDEALDDFYVSKARRR